MKRILIATAAAASTMSFGATNTVELKAGLVNTDDGVNDATNMFAIGRAKWAQKGDVDAGYSYQFRLDLNDMQDGGTDPLDYANITYTTGMHAITVGLVDIKAGGAEYAAASSIERSAESHVQDAWATYQNGLFYTNTQAFGTITLGVSNNEDFTDADTQAFANHFKFSGSFMGGNLLPVVQYSSFGVAENGALEAAANTYMSLGLAYKVSGATITLAQQTETLGARADGADDEVTTSTVADVRYTHNDFRFYLSSITDVDAEANGAEEVETAKMSLGLIHDCGKGVGVQADYTTVTVGDADPATVISLAVNAKIKG